MVGSNDPSDSFSFFLRYFQKLIDIARVSLFSRGVTMDESRRDTYAEFEEDTVGQTCCFLLCHMSPQYTSVHKHNKANSS